MEQWEIEDDEKDWKSSGLSCHIVRHPSLKHLCGYVRIPDEHPLFELDYDFSYEKYDLNVHGGITFSGEFKGKEGFWYGFDCAHLGDLSPGMLRYGHSFAEETYRTMEYVTSETNSLAAQISVLRLPLTSRVISYGLMILQRIKKNSRSNNNARNF